MMNMQKIESINAKGQGIITSEQGKVAVPGALPGDIVEGKINWDRGKIRSPRIQHGDYATQPFCSHFTACGGCQWQHLPYELQLKHKESILRAAYRDYPDHLGQDVEWLPILASVQTTYYRNKMEFTFSNHRWFEETELHTPNRDSRGLGLHVRKRFDRVVNIDTCYLQDSNEIRTSIRDFALEHSIDFYDVHQHTGLLRILLIRQNRQGDCMVVPMFSVDSPDEREKLLQFIQQLRNVTSVHYIINESLNDSLTACSAHHWAGEAYITERCGELDLRIYPLSFFQTNSYQAELLYGLVRKWAREKPIRVLYDVYCGIGSIGLFLADSADTVIGVESVESAVHAARENAQINSITNAIFVQGMAEDVLTEDFIAQYGTADMIIVDPPRMGLHPRVRELLLTAKCERIIYVSCNPITQAADVDALKSVYRLCRLQAVDMFPHTQHVESVALLERQLSNT